MSTVPSLLPALPEIVLAIGAMVLILYGAFAGERVTQTVNWAAFGLLIVAGLIVLCLPSGKLVTFGGGFILDDFARVLKILALIGSAVIFSAVALLASLGPAARAVRADPIEALRAD